MNIGVLGWWRASNQGDFAIRANLERGLAPHHIVPIDLPFDMTPEELDRLNLLDFLILGGGGLFQAAPPIPFDTFDRWGSRLKTPIGVVSVGVDAVTPRHRTAIHALVDQARFFYVRDQASQELVGHPNVQIMPDLTFLCPFPRAVNEASLPSLPVCGVNLRAFPSLELDRWIEALRQSPVRLRGIPLSTFSVCREVETLRQLDQDCPDVFDASLYQGLDLMVGVAFHSVLFAIQASIPVIGISVTPKVRRLFAELGLDEWLLGTDEWDKLPGLVRRALQCRSQLAGRLQKITLSMTHAAHKALAVIKQEIECAAKSHAPSGPLASLIVAGSASDADNRLTLASCLDQTYDNLEIKFVGDGPLPQMPVSQTPDQLSFLCADPAAGLADRLNQALTDAKGEYLTWATAGSYYAPDAISCMAAYLERTPDCDMVFADYYTLHAVDYIANAHSVDWGAKLFRGNVVGPCFLFRRRLSQTVGPLCPDTPCAAYDYWLRAGRLFSLHPLHARLFFAQASDEALRDCVKELQVRRQWRSTQPWLWRLVWSLADTRFVGSCIHSLMTALRSAGAVFLHRSERICK